jgi:hypothetical protein
LPDAKSPIDDEFRGSIQPRTEKPMGSNPTPGASSYTQSAEVTINYSKAGKLRLASTPPIRSSSRPSSTPDHDDDKPTLAPLSYIASSGFGSRKLGRSPKTCTTGCQARIKDGCRPDDVQLSKQSQLTSDCRHNTELYP